MNCLPHLTTFQERHLRGFSFTFAGRLSLTGYYSRLDDLIQLTFVQSAGLFISENVAEARILGFEVEGEYRWGPGFDSGFDCTYANSTDLVHERELRKRPRHQGRVYTAPHQPPFATLLRSPV